MGKCLFCSIRDKELPAHIIYEDDVVIVFLDIFPTKIHQGQCMVTFKEHQSSYFAVVNEDALAHAMKISQKIALAIDNALGSVRTCLVCEGMEIDHFHIKLYPIYKKTYPDYFSTLKDDDNKGIREDDRILAEICDRIKKCL